MMTVRKTRAKAPRKKKKKLTHREDEEIIVDEDNEAQTSELNGDKIILLDPLSNDEISM